MAYCTQNDIQNRIGADDLLALADLDGDGAVDSDVVEAAIHDACALIDSYLSVRYAVPVDPVPEVVKARAVNLAVYMLRLGRDSATEDARRQQEHDLEWLREAACGQVSLGIEPSASGGARAPGVEYDGRPRLFGRNEPL